MADLQRYGCVDDRRFPREIVILKGGKCSWGHCVFCDYKADNETNTAQSVALNKKVLSQVSGIHGRLMAVDSASFNELPPDTVFDLIHVARDKNIKEVILEGHWIYHQSVPHWRDFFATFGIQTVFVIGAESLSHARRSALKKGMPAVSAADMRVYFEGINLLHGDNLCLSNDDFMAEVESAAKTFSFVHVNIFANNTTTITRNESVVADFYRHYRPVIERDFPNVFILDFGSDKAAMELGGAGVYR